MAVQLSVKRYSCVVSPFFKQMCSELLFLKLSLNAHMDETTNTITGIYETYILKHSKHKTIEYYYYFIRGLKQLVAAKTLQRTKVQETT